MTTPHAIATLPRPKIKRIHITDPVARLAHQIETMLLDTSRNKDSRLREAVLICRDAQRLKTA